MLENSQSGSPAELLRLQLHRLLGLSCGFEFFCQFLLFQYVHSCDLVLEVLKHLAVLNALTNSLPTEVNDFLRDSEVVIDLL